MGPGRAVAEVRNAVREALDDLEPGELVLAACSGGADSLALAAALAFVAPRAGLRAGGVTVDHGLQEGSARRAPTRAAPMSKLRPGPAPRVTVTPPEDDEGAAPPPPHHARAQRAHRPHP